MTQRESYYKCCLNWGLWTCSTFVHVLLFLLVQTAKTDYTKISQLFFPYRIGNNHNSRTKLGSSKPKPRSAGLDLVFSHHVSMPSVRGAGPVAWNIPGPWWGDGCEPLEIAPPVFVSHFPCHCLILFIKQLVIECLTKKCLQAVFLVHNCLAEGNNNLGLNFSPPLSLSYHRQWQRCLCLKRKMD